MNERIRQLAEQAGLVKILEEHAHEYGAGTFENTPYPELEKFAELIRAEHTQSVIQLCARTINNNLNAEKQRQSNRWDNVNLVLIIIGMIAWVTFWYIRSH